MKFVLLCILCFAISVGFAGDAPKVEGTWTCSEKDCRIEIYKVGNTYEAKLLWAKKEIDEHGNHKLDTKNPDPEKRKLPVIGSKTLWNAEYNPESQYFENATAYRNGRYFCGKFKMNEDGSLDVIGYICSMRFLKYTENWTRVE